MSNNTQADEALAAVDTDIEKQLNTILPGSNPLQGMEAFHEGGLEYSVLSVRDGAPSYHYVTLGSDPSCTCADFNGNRKSTFDGEFGDREPCAHMVKAYLTERMSAEDLAVQGLINATATIGNASREAMDAAREARETATELDTGLARVRDAEAGAVASESTQTPVDNTESQTTNNDGEDLDALREKLQKAFDNVVSGFNVESNEGVLWVNKSPEVPDTLPGPGNVDIFKTFLQNPEQLEYVHDNHDYHGASPGQYFQNMIRPENVDEYISEVLE